MAEGNVSAGFTITFLSGLCTTLGALLPLFERLRNKTCLGITLAIAAGVMVFVSFVEILHESQIYFAELGYPDGRAATFAYICFFGGVAITAALDWMLHRLDRNPMPFHELTSEERATETEEADVEAAGVPPKKAEEDTEMGSGGGGGGKVPLLGTHAVSFRSDPCRWLHDDWTGYIARKEGRKLHHTGLVLCVALTIHNFPEGLATYVATLADEKLGIALGVAIALHNIPEGMCVAIPTYYATGSFVKALLLTFMSGMAQPLGAFIGYLVLSSYDIPAMYAVLFGVVSGMMVFISLKELLPTAHHYDPQDRFVTFAFVCGMFLMAFSLVLFEW
eukprot:NODE_1009_length_1170_cov_277.111508_g768_i0.p1 GENE.NODE_1009_length_1170_cov_277.111508_g768_i0~~NODE_1009_length_1170_cov_277.111508_g768_i0.p1  ORF type:complete len:334 (+),score=60.05 NODE_1009_length_1170_cov_277.111508_g768_i0:120-1121(+)